MHDYKCERNVAAKRYGSEADLYVHFQGHGYVFYVACYRAFTCIHVYLMRVVMCIYVYLHIF